jgi:glycosyltransferase involved in cell wall biosynthesis
MDRLISVVIPTFDRKDLTDRAAESVIPSCPDLFEIIIVDDCGTIPYAYNGSVTPSGVPVRIFRMKTNQGPGPARKFGVEKAEGAIIAFLDSDDVFEQGWPDAIQAEVLGRGSAFRDRLFITGRALGGSRVHSLSSKLLGFVPDGCMVFWTRLLVIAFNPFYTPATAISKQLCSFWTAGRYCEDYFTNAMAILKANRISVLPNSACTIFRSPGSTGGLSESQRKMWSGEFQVRKSILHSPDVPLGYRMLVPLGMAYALARNMVKSAFRRPHLEPLVAPQISVPDWDHDRTPVSRVAVLGTRGIPAGYGGFETFAENLATGLSELGFDVTVFCESGTSVELEAFRGVKLRYVSAPALGPLRTILYDLRCLWMARSGFDIVYMLGYGAALFCFIPRLFGSEVWINPDGLEWARAKWGPAAKLYFRLMEWVSIRTANRIIADAKTIEISLASRHGELKACSVIPYGCEVVEVPPAREPLSKWDLEADEYYLLVCRLEPENHVREILQAFKSSRSKRKLIVVGNHASGTRYVESLLSIHDPRIQMIGTLYDQDQLRSLRYYSFAYFHGHSVGGTNPSLLEAMGCGNLIMAHDNPFNRETLAEAGTFFTTPDDLTQAIESVDRNPLGRGHFQQAARSRARENYSWQEIIAKYAELMRN